MELNNRERKFIMLGGLFLMVGLSAFVFGGEKELGSVIFNERFNRSESLDNRSVDNSFREDGVGVLRQKKTGITVDNVKTVKVYVTGAVGKPGIYDVPAKIRSLEVIKLAGGFDDSADVEKVNVTRVVRDGMQINVPVRKKNVQSQNVNLGEEKKRVRSFKRPERSLAADGFENIQGIYVEVVPVPEGAVVSLGRANVKELSRLPGLHPELARRIIAYRQQYGFMRIEDILLVRGITPEIYEKVYKYLVL